MNGSVQLNRYFSARRNGRSMMNAAIEAGIGIGEARLIENDELRAAAAENRRPFASVEVSKLLDEIEKLRAAAEPEPQPIPAPEPAPQPKEDDMMTANEGTVNGEVPKPDFERAIKIIRNDLNPLSEESAKTRGDQSAAWKTIEKDCHCNKKAMKQVHALMRMDPELRDDYLRTLYGGMQAAGIGITNDLVDQMGGDDAPKMPVAERAKPKLATVPKGPADDSDLADDHHDMPAAAE